MKYLDSYRNQISCNNAEEVFSYLIDNLNDSITFWDYFVNWEKCLNNLRQWEVDLNTLNYLVGKEDVEDNLKYLLEQTPSIIHLIPVLLACRDSDFKILADFASGELVYESFSFRKKSKLSEEDIEKAVLFARESGLLKLFENKTIKSVPDYVLGVEVGLDSNGRKNRGGTSMEKLVESLLVPICKRNALPCMVQASTSKVRREWGLNLSADKSRRSYDFAVKNGNKLILIETNYYRGAGSKLKATAGEYKSLQDFLKNNGHEFIWITDGQGWKTTVRSLNETFEHIDYLLNLKMVVKGTLEDIVVNI